MKILQQSSRPGFWGLPAAAFALAILIFSGCDFNFRPPEGETTTEFEFEPFVADGEGLRSNQINDIRTDAKGNVFVATQGGGIAVYLSATQSWTDFGYENALEAGTSGDISQGDLSARSEWALPTKIQPFGENQIFVSFSAGLEEDGLVWFDGEQWQKLDLFAGANDIAGMTLTQDRVVLANLRFQEYGTFLPQPDSSQSIPVLNGQALARNETGDSTGGTVNLANSPLETSNGLTSEISPDFPENIMALTTDDQFDPLAVVERILDTTDTESTDPENVSFDCGVGPSCRREILLLRLNRDNPTELKPVVSGPILLQTEERFFKEVTTVAHLRLSPGLEQVFIGTRSGLLMVRLLSAGVLQSEEVLYDTESPIQNLRLPDPVVTCLTVDDRGVLWIGTENGLALYRDGQIQILDTTGLGLPDPGITALAAHGGEIWVGTSLGMGRVTRVN